MNKSQRVEPISEEESSVDLIRENDGRGFTTLEWERGIGFYWSNRDFGRTITDCGRSLAKLTIKRGDRLEFFEDLVRGETVDPSIQWESGFGSESETIPGLTKPDVAATHPAIDRSATSEHEVFARLGSVEILFVRQYSS